jgi:hypothetical protein
MDEQDPASAPPRKARASRLRKRPGRIKVEVEVAGVPSTRRLKLGEDDVYRLEVNKKDRSVRGALMLLAAAATPYNQREVTPSIEKMSEVVPIGEFVAALLGGARDNAVAALEADYAKRAASKANKPPRVPPAGFGRKKVDGCAEVQPEAIAEPPPTAEVLAEVFVPPPVVEQPDAVGEPSEVELPQVATAEVPVDPNAEVVAEVILPPPVFEGPASEGEEPVLPPAVEQPAVEGEQDPVQPPAPDPVVEQPAEAQQEPNATHEEPQPQEATS